MMNERLVMIGQSLTKYQLTVDVHKDEHVHKDEQQNTEYINALE